VFLIAALVCACEKLYVGTDECRVPMLRPGVSVAKISSFISK
jgi:hypothetical protein